MKRILLLCLFSFICGCAATREPSHIMDGGECPSLYVILPENYIIELAAQSEVLINPLHYEFVVFCTPGEAFEARKRGLAQGILGADKGWAVYRLAGEPREMAEVCHKKALCLKETATVEDWIEDGKSDL